LGLLELRPLVVVRCHAEGLASACSAFAPHLVAYAEDTEAALRELVYFLTDYMAELPPDQLQELVVPEEATLERLSVTLTREDLPRSDRVRTPVEVPTILLSAPGGAKWAMLPTLGQVAYVPQHRVGALHDALRDEVERLVAASDVDGPAYLDLLPSATFELVRPLVEVEVERGKEGSAKARALRDAERLLGQVARKVGEPPDAVLARDLTELGATLAGGARLGVVMVGAEGSGKSVWLRAAAASVGRTLYATSGAELVAGQSGLGQLEERIEAVVKAAELLDVALYFENLEDLFAGQTGGFEDIASSLRRPLQRGVLRLVGELTAAAYDRLSQRHVGFFSYLQRFNVAALEPAQTLGALAERARRRRRRGQRGMDAAARQVLVTLVERYEPYRVLPGKAIALFDELTGADSTSDAAPELDTDAVLHGFAAKSGIPAFLLRDERSLDVLDVEKFLHQHVIGQDEAVRRVAQTLCSVKAGLQPSGKPLATLLFLGPTGVGKTELCKALARFLFGSAERMARFDMSEYTDVYAADRLIRGTERADGLLTRRVREQPFGVVLLDELEKAHPSVFDLLLQVAGEGRLSDGRGKVAHFDNTIIVLTSNLGAQHRRSKVGFGDDSPQDDQSYYLEQVERHFRPELVGRLDAIVAFSSLSAGQLRQVARLSIERIARRAGIDGRESRLLVSDSALAALVEAGFSARYGARALRRYLEEALVAPLSTLVSALGEQATGAVFVVQASGEAELPDHLRALLTEYGPSQLPPLSLGSIVVTAALAARRRREKSTVGVASISRMRRAMRRWHALSQLATARERRAELTVQLAQAAHQRAPSSTVVALSREHARLVTLLAPLDDALRAVEEIESLLIAALDDSAPDLEPEARVSHDAFCEKLLDALFELSEEDALTFAAQELDDRRKLHDFLVPLLRFATSRGWEVILHFDRGAREEGAWPKVTERRWGPPIVGTAYLAELPAERPSDGVLVRVRGVGAGALLSFYLGRIRYDNEGNEPPGELWLRPFLARFSLKDEDWKLPRLTPVIDREVGRRQELAFWSKPGREHPAGPSGDQHEDVAPYELFTRYASLLFESALEKAQSGQQFLSMLPQEDP
jgi:ATP-dependent Clp protease ATP-binding subunit ClpC